MNKNIINKIYEYKNLYKNSLISFSYYPFSERINDNLIQKTIKSTELSKLKSLLKKYSFNFQELQYIETYFRDLIKIDIINKDKKTTNYYKKKSYLSFDNFITSIYDTLDEYNFPKLNNYNNKVIKFLTIFQSDSYDIVVTKNDKNTYTIHFELFNCTKNCESINDMTNLIKSKLEFS